MILAAYKLNGHLTEYDHERVGFIDLWKIGLAASNP